jgi:hypothetical protein
LLGLKNTDLAPAQVQQLSGSNVAFRARKPIKAQLDGLPGCDFELKPVFCQGDRSLWGRADFFSAFESITFNERAEELVLVVP